MLPFYDCHHSILTENRKLREENHNMRISLAKTTNTFPDNGSFDDVTHDCMVLFNKLDECLKLYEHMNSKLTDYHRADARIHEVNRYLLYCRATTRAIHQKIHAFMISQHFK